MAQNPVTDGLLVEHLVLIPAIVTLVGGLDYHRRLSTIWVAARYLAKLHVLLHGTPDPARKEILDWAQGIKEWPRLVDVDLREVLGYEISFMAGHRFKTAVYIRYGIWAAMSVIAAGAIITQYWLLAHVPRVAAG